MAKAPSPLVGYNNNVRHKGRVFHIQTEDSGVLKPHVITHLFMDGGRIVKSVKRSYAEHVEDVDVADVVRKLMREQHKGMFLALRDGSFDDIIEGRPSATEGMRTSTEMCAVEASPSVQRLAGPLPSVPDLSLATSDAPRDLRATLPEGAGRDLRATIKEGAPRHTHQGLAPVSVKPVTEPSLAPPSVPEPAPEPRPVLSKIPAAEAIRGVEDPGVPQEMLMPMMSDLPPPPRTTFAKELPRNAQYSSVASNLEETVNLDAKTGSNRPEKEERPRSNRARARSDRPGRHLGSTPSGTPAARSASPAVGTSSGGPPNRGSNRGLAPEPTIPRAPNAPEPRPAKNLEAKIQDRSLDDIILGYLAEELDR